MTLEFKAEGLSSDAVVSIEQVKQKEIFRLFPNEDLKYLRKFLGSVYRLEVETADVKLEHPVAVSFRIPDSDAAAADTGPVQLLIMQAEGENPELVGDWSVGPADSGGLEIHGNISHFSLLSHLPVPNSRNFCRKIWKPVKKEPFKRKFPTPDSMKSAKVTGGIEITIQPELTICGGFFNRELGVTFEGSLSENATLDFTVEGKLEKKWTSESFTVLSAPILVGPFPVVVQLDIFVEANANLEASSTIQVKQDLMVTVNNFGDEKVKRN